MSTDKDRASSSSSIGQKDKDLLQTLLGNTLFQPQTRQNTTSMERIYFGRQNLIFYPPSNLSFRVKPETKIDRPQRCLIDNLWISYNKTPRDNSYFVSVVNSLSHYFTDKNEDKKFRFYVVVQGKLQGVFQTWIEVVDSIKDFPTPLFKGFNNLNEALDYARGTLGPNYFISPALRQVSRPSLQYNIQKDTDRIIFCDHCSSMTEGFKRLNQTIERLETEKGKMIRHSHSLQERIRFLLGNVDQTIHLESSPSHYKWIRRVYITWKCRSNYLSVLFCF